METWMVSIPLQQKERNHASTNEQPSEESQLEGKSWMATKFYPGGIFGYPSYAVKFVNWGYPAWFAFVVGAGEIFAAIMLLLPRRRFLGAVVLAFILTGAVATHIINHDTLADSISAPVHLILAGIVALATWPADWREPLALGGRKPESLPSASQRS